MKNSLLLLSALFFLNIAQAQTIIVVKDKVTQKPIYGVAAKLPDGSGAVSDEAGIIKLMVSQETVVMLSHLAYEPYKLSISPDKNFAVELVPSVNSLSELVVQSYQTERQLIEQAAPISVVRPEDLARFNEGSIVQSFNTKPGVRIEERAPASYRISIRGSALRSPFGVRNVKVYWNDIPFTSPDGTTPLNLLDLSNIQTAEIIKGPAGSIYGAGTGGVVSLESNQRIQKDQAEASLLVGDYGLQKYRVAVSQQLENAAYSFSYVDLQADGYRAHSATDRKVLQLSGHWYPSSRQSLSANLLYADLKYQIPGALNATQLAENPRQARPGSIDQNSSIDQQSLYLSFSHTYDFSDNWSNTSTLNLNTTDFENPFILDYKRELQNGLGLRSSFTFADQLGALPFKWISGLEYQISTTQADNFGNRSGIADTVRFSDRLGAKQYFFFTQAELELPQSWIVTLGVSQNYFQYDIDRRIDASGNAPARNIRNFDPVLIPRLAVLKRVNAHTAIHGSISYGFSSPTIDEVRTNEGSINLDLESERGINYELGWRTAFLNNHIQLDATAFYFQLSETITSFTNEQGVVLFRNAGSTDQKGIEVLLTEDLIKPSRGAFMKSLRLTQAYTGHFFEFKNYESGGDDFSGNQLTGVAPNILVNQLDLETKQGIYLNVTSQWTDEIPLNDANTVYQATYHLLSARLGWRATWSGWEAELYVGAENLLNEAYSLGNDLNAFGGRFYQPAPERNGFSGLKLTKKF